MVAILYFYIYVLYMYSGLKIATKTVANVTKILSLDIKQHKHLTERLVSE